jgi:pimeloyl-ACP methyl ester carboxylesterase
MDDLRTFPGILTLANGRELSFVDYGPPEGLAVLWCHGGPGSRLEPTPTAAAAAALGFRLIGIDRPGYGETSLVVGRDIGDWPADALALADHLDIGQFLSVGVSTGGAYALALAAAAPRRVLGVVACCAVSDMRWTEGRAMMAGAAMVWDAPDRDTALRLTEALFGPDGSRLADLSAALALPPSDLAAISDAAFVENWGASTAVSFEQGVAGYVDDRIADGRGWGGFDVHAISCPVIVLHGEADTIVPLAHARHTAALVRNAQLRTAPDLGHFSIIGEVPATLGALRGPAGVRPVDQA